jgi:hypothetical protein
MCVFVVHVHFKNQCLDPEQTYGLWEPLLEVHVTKHSGSTIMGVQSANTLLNPQN